MRKLALWMAITFAAMAQPDEKKGLLLPHQVRASGIVVDTEGNPIAGATVAHANLRTRAVETDTDGKFTVNTDAPKMVIEKRGYRSLRIMTTETRDARVSLDHLANAFPPCHEISSRMGLSGSGGGLYFRKTTGVKPTQPVTDVDYTARRYLIAVGGKEYFVYHGTGPMWSGGEPPDEVVWQSIEFEQRDYVAGGFDVVDAHGTMPDGTRWRHLGTAGTSASYEKVPPAAAAILDELLDSACWKPSSQN